jgi:hypothetical protein
VDQFIKAFQRNADGSWTCVAPATIDGPNGRIQVARGHTFAHGRKYMGVDLAKWLDDQAEKDRLKRDARKG